MNKQDNKYQPQGFRESEEFKQLQAIVHEGFTIQNTTTTKSDLLELSEKLAKTLKKSERRDSDTVNQFRKFFNQVNGLKKSGDDAAKLSAELRLLKARMSYATGRQAISRDFNLVIQECVESILKQPNLQIQLTGFCDFFESLYAFYYYQTQKDMIRRRRG